MRVGVDFCVKEPRVGGVGEKKENQKVRASGFCK